MGRRFGDRKDGKLIRDIDALHFTMANIWVNRCDREVYVSQTFDLTSINDYLDKKNKNKTEHKYSLFQVIVTIALKAIILRPQLNRFIANKNFYQRNDVSVSFIVKKRFMDDGEEGMAIIRAESNDNIDTVHQKIFDYVNGLRNSDTATDSTDGAIKLMQKLPRFISKSIFDFLRFLDRHGWLPESLTVGDSNYSSVMMANLGSIKLPSVYHHLNNWGTCSFMCVIGERKNIPVFDNNGSFKMISSVELGLTYDEAISDGYYVSRTLKLIRKLFENPELLELPLSTEVDY